MAGNLPAGVSVSDFNEPEEPTCNICGNPTAEPPVGAEAVDLCAEHMTDEHIENERENARHRSGIECEVCHKPLLPSEARSTDPALCQNHTEDDLQTKREHDELVRREALMDAHAERSRLV